MKKLLSIGIAALMLTVGALVVCHAQTQGTAALDKVPDQVMKTFKSTFPEGKILKLDVDVENGVTVYDLEFKDGPVEKETDITADGTMLEYTVVVEAKALPAAAMKTIQKAAEGTTIKRIERIEISFDTKDGKAIKLPKPITHYAVEMAKGDQTAEVVVDPEGAVIEPPKWGVAKEDKNEDTNEEKAEKDAKAALEKAPKVVQATVKKLLGDGEVDGFALESDGNYELEYEVKEVAQSATISPSGKIMETEVTVEATKLPTAVLDAVKRLYPNGKIKLAEMSTVEGRSVYELSIVVGVTISPEGKVQEEESSKGKAAESNRLKPSNIQ
jgi:uncharacterized membrane protein YkoI